MIILNTGGTFNKIYDPLIGELVVPKNSYAIEEILSKSFLDIPVEGLIYKDSLFMSDEDREELVQKIKTLSHKTIVIVHGTDTMNESAEYVAKRIQDRCIVFTGAMVPYSIDSTEASANLMLAIAKAKYGYEEGVFVAMHGIVEHHSKIVKDRAKGRFCRK